MPLALRISSPACCILHRDFGLIASPRGATRLDRRSAAACGYTPACAASACGQMRRGAGRATLTSAHE